MITVFVNGNAVTVPEGRLLSELVDAHTTSRSGVAVAVDGEVVPRTAWDSFALAADARVEVLTAMQGG